MTRINDRDFLLFSVAAHAEASCAAEIQKAPHKLLANAVISLALKSASREGWLCGTYMRSLREALESNITAFICYEEQKALIRYCCNGCTEPIEDRVDKQIDWLLDQTPMIHINQHNTKLYERR